MFAEGAAAPPPVVLKEKGRGKGVLVPLLRIPRVISMFKKTAIRLSMSATIPPIIDPRGPTINFSSYIRKWKVKM